MSELRFVGGMSLIYGIVLAVVAGIAAVLLYYRQYRDNGRMATGVALTVLRVSALALVLLMLTGPVWHREHSVPQRGRVIVLVDESQSMQTGDPAGSAWAQTSGGSRAGLATPDIRTGIAGSRSVGGYLRSWKRCGNSGSNQAIRPHHPLAARHGDADRRQRRTISRVGRAP